jgi:hypothetical protein
MRYSLLVIVFCSEGISPREQRYSSQCYGTRRRFSKNSRNTSSTLAYTTHSDGKDTALDAWKILQTAQLRFRKELPYLLPEFSAQYPRYATLRHFHFQGDANVGDFLHGSVDFQRGIELHPHPSAFVPEQFNSTNLAWIPRACEPWMRSPAMGRGTWKASAVAVHRSSPPAPVKHRLNPETRCSNEK